MKNLKRKTNIYSLLALYLIFLTSCNLKEDKRPEAFRSFLHYYKNNVLKGEKLMVASDPIISKQYDEIWSTLNIDSLKKKNFDSLRISKWDQTYFKDASFLSLADIQALYNDVELQKKYYNEGLGYYSISQPYISQDGDYVLISTYYTCGSRCGYSHLKLFVKYQNTWKLVKTYSEGIS